jgi:hypothetical protein
MRVARRVAAGAVFDQHALDALAGNVRQLVLVDEGHLGVLRLRRAREDAGYFGINIDGVRRQSFWDIWRLKLRESLAPLVNDIMRLVVGAASGD